MQHFKRRIYFTFVDVNNFDPVKHNIFTSLKGWFPDYLKLGVWDSPGDNTHGNTRENGPCSGRLALEK